jgi:hypothetical protein
VAAPESPAEQAARDSWVDATALEHAQQAEKAIDALNVIIAACKSDGGIRRIFERELAAWKSQLDGISSRSGRTLRFHASVKSDGPQVCTMLRFIPGTGRYEVAQRVGRAETRRLHSYGNRADAERRFEELTNQDKEA